MMRLPFAFSPEQDMPAKSPITLRMVVDILTDEYHSISAQLKRLEARFDRMEADRLERRVSVLENKVSELENSGRN